MSHFKKQFLIFLFLLNLSLGAYEYELAVCCIFKNSKPFLKEWIEFHRLVGVEHFYLYNNESSDDPEEILQAYIEQGVVTLIDWPNQKEEEWKNDRYAWVYTTQVTAYNHCRDLALGQAKWLAVIDSDEFVVPIQMDSIIPLLREHENESGISIYWDMYGTSGVYDIPPNKLMIELLTLKESPNSKTKTTKVIVKTECLNYFANSPHWCYYLNQATCYQCEKTEMKINHYVNRTIKFLIEEKWKQKETMDNTKLSESQARAAISQWNHVEDLTMHRFIDKLRNRMGFEDEMN